MKRALLFLAVAVLWSGTSLFASPQAPVERPDLTITKTHTGSFMKGQLDETYTLTVMNIGGGRAGFVYVEDVLPEDLVPTAVAGDGWACQIAYQEVTCSRFDGLNAGASFPPITITVRVALNNPAPPPSLTNRATVYGEGDINPGNNIASDITTIGPGPDLAINKSHTGNFLQGQTGAIYTITVSNPGTEQATGVVTVTDNVPAGLVPTSAAGTGWICNVSGQDVNCTRSDPLASGQSYSPITLMVNVQPGAPGSVINTATFSGGADVNPANNSDTDLTTIIPGAGPDLTITKSHAGNLNQGQIGATYTVTARNIGLGATTGTVTVVDNFPPALIPTAAVGSGWTCNISTNSATCTRTDPLAAGGSYPPITLTVNVASTAPPSVNNSAVVTGGNDGNSANNTVTDPTTIIGGPDLTITKTATPAASPRDSTTPATP